MTTVFGALRTPVRRSPLYMAIVGSVALVAAIANSAASVGFPVGAPWERVFNVLVTVDLLVMAVALVVAAVVVSRRLDDAARSRELVLGPDGRPARPSRSGVLAIVGVVLLAVDWILWIASALPALVSGLASGTPAYFTVSFVTALFGPLWVIGTAFAVIGFHRGGSARNRTLAIVGAALTGAMMAVTVVVAMLFATGMVA